MMNTNELSKKVASNLNITQVAVREVVDELIHVLKEEIKNGEEIKITGFGKFYAEHQDARVYKNPQTGEPVNIPEKDVPKFKYFDGYKKEVAGL